MTTIDRRLCPLDMVLSAWLVMFVALASNGHAQEGELKDGQLRFGKDPRTGTAQAVLVVNQALGHTGQLLPIDSNGKLVAPDAAGQIESLLNREVHPASCVKLNFYVANPDVTAVVQEYLGKNLKYETQPAVSFVQTRLPLPGALVAVDAIGAVGAASRERFKSWPKTSLIESRIAHASLLKAGPRVYISGQAEKGATLADATRLTLEGLRKTLAHLNLGLDDVVQVKCFLTPMDQVADVQREIVEFFAPVTNILKPAYAPPCVFVEWQSTLPIEIELIVTVPQEVLGRERAADKQTPREPLEFITPPGTTASPVFCRVVRINDPRTIFVSGLFARDAGDGAAQVSDVFAQLQEILKTGGSDLRHLAKATYYVSDNDASAKLNELRPKFYDPARPPAASKAQVFGVGMTGRSLTLDMIAVPAK